MHEYELLEKRWKRYKFKKLIKKLGAVGIVFAGAYLILSYSLFNHNTPATIKHPAKTSTSTPQPKSSPQIQKSSLAQEISSSISSSLPISSSHSSHSCASSPAPLLLPNLEFEKYLTTPTKAMVRHPRKTQPKKVSYTKASSSPIPTQHQKLHIQAQRSDIKTLQETFANHPNKNIALLIAQKFYELHKYQQALQWSIKANEFDKSDEKSWIIFAKSAYKMGDKRRALEALYAYLLHHPSPRAQALYLQMQKGTFQ